MKPVTTTFAFLLVVVFAVMLIQTPHTSAFQSPLASPAPVQAPTATARLEFQSPLASPVFRSKYVGRELVLTQEAQYVIDVSATRHAVATLRAATLTSATTLSPTLPAHLFQTPTPIP